MTDTLIRVRNRVVDAWTIVQASLQTISNDSEIRPQTANDVFTFARINGGLLVNVAPVTFRVPQKANAKTVDLYVTFSGWMRFNEDNVDTDLRSFGFKTQVGYFQQVSNTKLKTLLGLHYDWDDQVPAHPFYHSQVCQADGFAISINEQWNKTFTCESFFVASLNQVRIPTAQMDAFCVVAQIFSDHLINVNTPEAETDAYHRLMKACGFFECNAHEKDRCRGIFDRKTLRSPHWYPGANFQATRIPKAAGP